MQSPSLPRARELSLFFAPRTPPRDTLLVLNRGIVRAGISFLAAAAYTRVPAPRVYRVHVLRLGFLDICTAVRRNCGGDYT